MIKERIEKLRKVMKDNGIDAYYIPTNDFHGSEYVGDYFKCRKYITGFTGSAGTAVITMDEARLWTDGRYFIQAAAELEGSGITLMKMGQPEVPTIKDYLSDTMKAGQVLGFDGRCVDYKYAISFEEALHKNDARIVYHLDLMDTVWEDRPALESEKVKILDVKYCGEDRVSKLERIRKLMKEKKADIFVDVFRLADIFSDEPQLGNKTQAKNQKQQDEKMVKQIKSFTEELKHSGTIDFILSDDCGKIVLSAQEQYLTNDNVSEILGGHFKVLGKVICICQNENESIDLLRKTTLSILSEEMVTEMFSGLKNNDTQQFNLPELVTKITGPAAIVIPVAIYA